MSDNFCSLCCYNKSDTFHFPFVLLPDFETFFPSVFQVEAVLDKENFTLEELLDEEEIIQECKALNSRLINL